MTATSTVQPGPSLESIVHAQSNAMYDVMALIAAAEDRVELAASPSDKDAAHHTLRLLQMARVKVNTAITAFDPFI